MKKLMISLAVVSALGLTACDDETIADIEKENAEIAPVNPTARVVFDPSGGNLSVPNDLLLSSSDLTLNIPGVVDPTDVSDPYVGLNATDGWSTHQPFVIGIDFPDGVSLDPTSVFNSGGVEVYKAIMGLDLNDPECTLAVAPGHACKGVSKLVMGEDYIVQAEGNDLAFVPLKPLEAKTTYIVALTSRLQDTDGNPIAGSSTYELVKQDINESPIADPAIQGLQSIINSYEMVAEGFGANREEIIYTMAMTTQSVSDVLTTAKQLIVSDLADPTDLTKVPHVGVQQIGFLASHLLFGEAIADPSDPRFIYNAASVVPGKVMNARYYSGVPTSKNPTAPLNQPWKAECDSAIMVLGAPEGAIPEGPINEEDAYCMAFGLRDVGIDTERNLTKYNPIPKLIERQDLDIVMTVPELGTVNAIRASLMLDPIAKPENGWPVVMLQHGITGYKEQMLAVSGVLSVYGFATASIDHPLHGVANPIFPETRGYGEINASSDPTAYLNLASLLNGRDNLRQSVADALTLRMALNNVFDVTSGSPMPLGIDGNDVYYAGMSLGAITGTEFMAITNTSLGNANPAIDPAIVDPMFKVNGAVLSVPGGGIGNFLLESPAFAPLVKGSLAYADSPDFQDFVNSGISGTADLGENWTMFSSQLAPAQSGAFAGLFTGFTFAAQSIIDSADPVNYSAMLAANGSNILVHTVVGNGVDNLEDQVIPTKADASGNQISGSNPLISLLGLDLVSDMAMNETGVSGAVKFVNGHHGSLLTPEAEAYSINEARVTQEMQTQMAVFFASKGTLIKVSDDELVLK
ncbi:VolA/Pla-1 family phospholipase [Thalassomonas sp. M1454]|uniref:VolA/Pla-1 family phospholipase n=1 Tax=Thalassomonas sp. M1454 TaxID=2594477 RepID=UPI00117F4DF2|nr:VolA/Pla-1 family phospholipase [Thalassomonas sp. M1454]TRX56405.1 lipase [Thalassomonas sp. M1454]